MYKWPSEAQVLWEQSRCACCYIYSDISIFLFCNTECVCYLLFLELWKPFLFNKSFPPTCLNEVVNDAMPTCCTFSTYFLSPLGSLLIVSFQYYVLLLNLLNNCRVLFCYSFIAVSLRFGHILCHAWKRLKLYIVLEVVPFVEAAQGRQVIRKLRFKSFFPCHESNYYRIHQGKFLNERHDGDRDTGWLKHAVKKKNLSSIIL